MILNSLNLQLKGKIEYELYGPGGVIEKSGEVSNAIDTAIAREVVRRAIGDGDRVIDQIAVYKASGLLSAKTVASVTYSGAARVRYRVLFDFADFNDTLDEARLYCVAEGAFSTITGLSIAKTSLQQLGIIWSIDITIT
jgi:hypothetical protein